MKLAYFIAATFALMGTEANALPDQFKCVFEAFMGDGTVSQVFNRSGTTYFEEEPIGKPFAFQGSEDEFAYYIIHTINGTVTMVMIEKNDGRMMKITGGTYVGGVQSRKGMCVW